MHHIHSSLNTKVEFIYMHNNNNKHFLNPLNNSKRGSNKLTTQSKQ